MTINTSNLDFNDIKSKLKTHLRSSGEFEDYDFNTSGLSNILDVLAYNTHINALIANLAINESFLTTSQIRTSVIGHAESLGYSVKSRTAARAVVNVKLTIPNPPSTYTLNAGTEFTTNIDDIGYRFFTVSTHAVDISQDNTFSFENVQIVEGETNKRTFFANTEDNVSYVIQDKNIDTSTLSVRVKDNATSPDFVSYHDIQTVTTINDDSTVYMVNETPNGYYDITFSDGNVLGKRPIRGNVIEVSYISTNHIDGNGAQKFTLNGISGGEVVTVSPSAGGSERESTNSIKLNAPRAYTTQNRLVTADDHRALIQARHSNYIRDVVSWGGNDNLPPQYGKVFVSLDFRDGVDFARQDLVKESIISDLTSHLSIMSIDTEFVNPQKTYLEIDTIFQLDAVSKIDTTAGQSETVMQFIVDYVKENLGTFGSVFRRSNLLSEIDSIHPSILNSRMEVKGQQRFTTIIPVEEDYVLNFPFALASPDKDSHVITSSVFEWKGGSVIIKNELGSHKLQIFNLNGELEFSNIGYYDQATGKVHLKSLAVDTNGRPVEIKISAVPANSSTIRPLRNYIIELDESVSTTRALIDEGTIKVSL